MKTMNLPSIILLLFTLALSSCQSDEVAPFQPGGGNMPVNWDTPGPGGIPPTQVIRTEYPNATKWKITFDDPDYMLGNAYRRFFSTKDGSFHTLADINSSSQLTHQVDMEFLFGFIGRLNPWLGHGDLAYPDHIAETEFKPSDLTSNDLEIMTAISPSQFKSVFEKTRLEGTPFQPYNYELNGDESVFYKNGDVFLFKTDRVVPRYGAIRIIEVSNIITGIGPRIVEVIVQRPTDIKDSPTGISG